MKRAIAVIASLLAISLSFGLGFSFRDFWAGRAPSGTTFARLLGGSTTQETPNETFLANYTKILDNYYRPLEPTKLKYAALSGQVASLGDPYTTYFEPKTAESFTTETRGQLSGIGARLSDDSIGAKIVSVFKEGPAEQGGLRASDVIIAVNGEKTDRLPVDQVVTRVRGEAGTKVTITVNRPGVPTPLNFTITRRTVNVPTVEGKILPGNIGYISITSFAEQTQFQFDEILLDQFNKNVTGLVIDLRSNPGGVLQTTAMMLGRFFDDKKVVEMRGRQSNTVFTPRGKVLDFKAPIVVLINDESASASEIFAGVMKDYNRATLVGDHTFGKGSVQQLHQVGTDGSVLKVTVAKYFLPSGANVNRKVDDDGAYISGGIRADIQVMPKLDSSWEFGTPGKDNQLDRGIQVINEKLGRR